ncbi:MAG: hypothetical protein EOM34_10305 [Clostridia bacterium]|nr:hypothetical protein [Clostridia bacterium]NCD02949.1 hypothetical protein [Clostridia bacterium]
MLKQIKQLTTLQLCNLFGLNEIRHTRDKGKKERYTLMTLVWLLLIAMLVFYIAILSNAFISLGMAEIIPIYLYTITCLVILMFSFFKASGVIFQMNSFEILVSLPLSKSAIIVSRFLTMYSTNLLLSFLVMIPGTIIYGLSVHPGLLFYIFSFIGTLFLPLLPMTLSTAIGTVITAIGSRMKHKSLASGGMIILFAIAVIIANTIVSNQSSMLTPDMLKNIAATVTSQIGALYPPAIWFGNAVLHSDILALFALVSLSAAVFILMAVIIQKYFLTICTALNATSTKNNYKLQSLSAASLLKALWQKELKRYFASSVYISNTIIGYLMMVLVPVALLVAGIDKMELMFQCPGMIEKILPLILGIIAGIMPSTSCSISMEGKNWWLAQTLPIKSKTLYDSKILTHLSVVFPFYLVALILSWIALKPSLLSTLWLILIPGVYILFSSVAGITINLLFPVLVWENETRIVKQSASTMVTMLIDFIICLPPIAAVFLLKNIPVDLIMGITLIVLALLTGILYTSNNRKPILRT